MSASKQALPADAAQRALAPQPGLVVVKLGGSVVRSPELSAWLDVIAANQRPIVVVPGGGALADEVRAAQAKLGFGDGAAHRMALLAMDQLAWAIAGLRSGFEVGDTEDALRRTLGQGRVAVWAPYSLVADRSDIPQSWTVTSDSLALWLAPAPRRRMLLCHQVHRAEPRRNSAPSSSRATVWSMKPSPPC